MVKINSFSSRTIAGKQALIKFSLIINLKDFGQIFLKMGERKEAV